MLPGKIQTASLLVKISFCFTLLYNTDKYHHIPNSSDGSRLEQFPEDGSRLNWRILYPAMCACAAKKRYCQSVENHGKQGVFCKKQLFSNDIARIIKR